MHKMFNICFCLMWLRLISYGQDTTYKEKYNFIYTNFLSANFNDYAYNMESKSFPLGIGYKKGILNNKYIIGIEGGIVVRNSSYESNDNLITSSGFYNNIEFQTINVKNNNYFVVGFSLKYTENKYFNNNTLDNVYRTLYGVCIGYNKIIQYKKIFAEVGFGPVLYYSSYNRADHQLYFEKNNRHIYVRLKTCINIGIKI